ncbi:LysR family transcriptional regulator [Palleronia sediminis]|uniref:LysR family transcriptional regulator n=1 Tax=Palleronia sediminis TaxID=2547833 RepID=A0A4R6A6R4_9RHOB|nr:LysR family transcriptional regulator [Palleronia sediminis]TDL78452.1 LysR family transcriptional regulator [Palleronia sediminis]
MSIKLEAFRVFRAVAEAGTLAAGARAVGRTPSAVSMTLAQLETEIGAPLFETDRKNRLTPLGHRVLEESSRATDVFDRAVSAIRRHAISSAGSVRIAAVPSAAIALLPETIERFRREHPHVRIEIADTDTTAVRRRVRTDEADIGIVSAGSSDPPQGALIRRDDLGVVCTEGGPIHRAHLAEAGSSSWRIMELEPLIANPLCQLVDHPAIRDLLSTSALEARNTTAILTFVRQGLGASILPFDSVRGQPDGIEFFVPSDPATQRELRKIRQDGSRMTTPAERFWEML